MNWRRLSPVRRRAHEASRDARAHGPRRVAGVGDNRGADHGPDASLRGVGEGHRTSTRSAVGDRLLQCRVLAGAERRPLDGTGYAVMRPSRRRLFGHAALINYLTALRKTEALLLGICCWLVIWPPTGSATLSGHAGHQNGLDADIWFVTRATRPTDVEREKLGAPGS